jgi:hypothetical protein
MSKKEIKECHCVVCDSEFKVIFEESQVSSFYKFCTFCGSELFDEDDDEYIDEDNGED